MAARTRLLPGLLCAPTERPPPEPPCLGASWGELCWGGNTHVDNIAGDLPPPRGALLVSLLRRWNAGERERERD